ncbi:MAG TPA: MBL fold metallo-hydrolase [Solirubrobacteraceae bacterium]|nr:MBL fold metallo-hydrolase [Solirubrobacteraceae bacterium]
MSDPGPPEPIDLRYGGRPGALCAWLTGDTLIDCGPSACLGELLAGLGERRPRRLLLTHIHFDHAGAAGSLVERWPELRVHVHPRGAPHLVDPARLLRSARRVFEERFDGLLGDVVPVPEANLDTIADGQRIGAFLAAWTPGHADHHVAFLDEASRWAYPGDVAGVRLSEGVVIPPTPPPDIDLDAWRDSLELLEGWRAQRLALPHFGLVEDPVAHLAELRAAIDRHERWAREGEEAFVAHLTEDLRRRLPASQADAYSFTALAQPSALGLRRWLERGAAAPRRAAG